MVRHPIPDRTDVCVSYSKTHLTYKRRRDIHPQSAGSANCANTRTNMNQHVNTSLFAPLVHSRAPVWQFELMCEFADFDLRIVCKQNSRTRVNSWDIVIRMRENSRTRVNSWHIVICMQAKFTDSCQFMAHCDSHIARIATATTVHANRETCGFHGRHNSQFLRSKSILQNFRLTCETYDPHDSRGTPHDTHSVQLIV